MFCKYLFLVLEEPLFSLGLWGALPTLFVAITTRTKKPEEQEQEQTFSFTIETGSIVVS
jgi:hypothetical protein